MILVDFRCVYVVPRYEPVTGGCSGGQHFMALLNVGLYLGMAFGPTQRPVPPVMKQTLPQWNTKLIDDENDDSSRTTGDCDFESDLVESALHCDGNYRP